MLNEGSSAESWVPPESNSFININFYGKNLLSSPKTGTNNGLIFNTEEDGSISLSGSPSGFVNFALFNDFKFPDASYILSTDPILPSGNYISCRDKNNKILFRVGNNSKKETVINSFKNIDRIEFNTNTNIEVIKSFKIQLEIGNSSTSYEQSKFRELNIDMRIVTLNGLPDGTSDEIILKPDGSTSLIGRIVCVRIEKEQWILNNISGDEVLADKNYVFSLSDYSLNASSNFSQICDVYIPHTNSLFYPPNNHIRVSYNRDKIYLGLPEGEDPKSCVLYFYSNADKEISESLPEELPSLPDSSSHSAVVFANGVSVNPETELIYERDVTTVINNLEAKIADLIVSEESNV